MKDSLPFCFYNSRRCIPSVSTLLSKIISDLSEAAEFFNRYVLEYAYIGSSLKVLSSYSSAQISEVNYQWFRRQVCVPLGTPNKKSCAETGSSRVSCHPSQNMIASGVIDDNKAVKICFRRSKISRKTGISSYNLLTSGVDKSNPACNFYYGLVEGLEFVISFFVM